MTAINISFPITATFDRTTCSFRTKKKTLTSRSLSATGWRKGAKASADPFTDENANLNTAGPQLSTPSKPHPKPRPLVKRAANGAKSNVTEQENGEVTAVHALITLQNRLGNHINSDNSPSTNHHFYAAATSPPKDMNLNLSSDEDNDEEEEGGEEEQLEEIDELEDDIDDSGEFMQQLNFTQADNLYSRPFSPYWLTDSA